MLGTIRDNLLYGNKDATEEEILESLENANAGFVHALEKGIYSSVGSDPVLNLSGGQKQRIAIARALVKNPQILVLDEATSALDPNSEKEVQDAISNIQQNKKDLTIIIIAHRMQTIMSADNLLYFDSNHLIIPAKKGTKQYKHLIKRLVFKKKDSFRPELLTDKL